MFMTCGSFWSTWMVTRWVLPSAAGLAETNAIDSNAEVAKQRRKLRMMNSLRSNQRISVFGQRENLPDPDLNRARGGNDVRSLAGFALDGFNGIETDIEAHALRDQALDQFAVGIRRAQQIDAGTECHYLDRDLVGIVRLEHVGGCADHAALLLGVIVRELQRDAVLGERLVRQRRRLGPGDGRHHRREQRRPRS